MEKWMKDFYDEMAKAENAWWSQHLASDKNLNEQLASQQLNPDNMHFAGEILFCTLGMKCSVLFSGINPQTQKQFITEVIQNNSFASNRTIENLMMDYETNEQLLNNLEHLHKLGMTDFVKLSVWNNKEVVAKFQDDDEVYDENDDVLYHKNPWKTIELGLIQIPESKKTANFGLGSNYLLVNLLHPQLSKVAQVVEGSSDIISEEIIANILDYPVSLPDNYNESSEDMMEVAYFNKDESNLLTTYGIPNTTESLGEAVNHYAKYKHFLKGFPNIELKIAMIPINQYH